LRAIGGQQFPRITALVDNPRPEQDRVRHRARSSIADQERMPDLVNPSLPLPALLLLPVEDCGEALTVAIAPLGPVEVRTRAIDRDWRRELAGLQREFPQRALLRVRRADLWIAEDGLLRLLKAAAASAGPVTCASNNDFQLTPAAPDCVIGEVDPAAIDDALHALSRRQLHAIAATAPLLLALAAGADAGAALAVTDHLYAQVQDQPVRGLPTPKDRRERAPAHALAPVRRALLRAGAGSPAPWPQTGRDSRPVILHVLHGWGGGAERFVGDLAASDPQRHHLVLRAHGNPGRRLHGEFLELADARGGATLRRWLLSPAIGAVVGHHDAYAQALASLIADHCVEQIWVSSLIGHALDVLRCGLPVRWIAHDYFPFWPALHRDFGAADARWDATELAADMASLRNGPFAENDPQWWSALAAAARAELLRAGAEIVAPSRSTLDNLLRVAPDLSELPQRCIAHGSAGWPDYDHAGPLLPDPDIAHGKLRLLVLGRVNGAKGLHLLRQLLPALTTRCDVYLVGAGKAAEALFGVGGVHIQLDYEHAQLPDVLARIRPHAALLPSTVSETFSYTLSELWRLAIPPIATRLGAFAERIEDDVDGILVDADAASVLGLIAALDRDRARLQRIREELLRRPQRTLAQMRNDYAALLPTGTRPPLRYAVAIAGIGALEHAELADGLTDHELRLDAAQARLAQQDAELSRRAEWGFDLNRQLDERTRWARDLEQELERTRQWMNQRENVFQQSVSDERARRQEAQDQLSRVEAELRKTMEEARIVQDAQNEQIETLSRALAANTEALETLTASNRQLQLLRAELESERDQIVQERESLRQARDTLQRERDAIAEHRSEMLRSTSWRITGPLRAVGQLLKRARASLRFRASRLSSLIGRVRGSLSRRGLRGTLSRARQELRDQGEQPPTPLQIEHPTPSAVYEPFNVPTSSEPLVSIIVPVYNQLHHTRNCLQALADTATATPIEVIVVDDGSSDATALEVPRIGGVRFHKNPENLGFIGACNAGAALARGQYLLFLNNDTAVQPGWLEPLLSTFAQFERVGLVGSKLIYPDGRLQEAGGIVFNDGSGWNYGRFDHPDDPRYDYPREADYCSGAAILIEKSLFDRFGGFDSLYKPAYYEDTDLAFKVRDAGLRVIYQPASKVVHFEGITSGTDTGSGTKRYQVINQQKFLERWKDALAMQPAPTDHAGIWRAATHRAKGRILLIDATTPTPDQDSGSVRYLNLIRVLRALGWQCTFFADNRAYIPRYTDELRALGVEVQFHPWLSDPVAFFRERGRQFDAIMLSRHYVARHYVDLAREHAPQALVLFDTVDLHYLREQRAAAIEASEPMARQAAATRATELDLIARCDVTLVVSPVERELLAREAPGRRVEVLSNIHEVAGRRRDYAERRDIWFVGGFQHQPNIDAVAWFAAEIWPRVRAQIPELTFHIVGSKITPAVEALAGNGIEVHGFVEDIHPFLDGCRVAVAPLRYGAGVKGKVNQSMAYGQPVVATPIAVEGMEIEAGTEALVASEPAQFADEIVCLYRDPDLWLKLSDAGLANIRAHFSFEAASAALQRILKRS
jgi:GT2 family glycosyltransferase/glycosyltransferase involved in cell wall biosynthesis